MASARKKRYLERRDINIYTQAKAKIKECYAKNKAGDPMFRSLTASMKAGLRLTVGEEYWKKCHDYLTHALKEKQQQCAQQEEHMQQP